MFADYPGHIPAAILSALVVVAVWIASGFGRHKPPPVKQAGRLLVLVCAMGLLCILWNPLRLTLAVSAERISIAAVFDTSLSMSLGQAEDSENSRLDAAVSAFEAGLLDMQAIRWHLYGFDESLYYAGSPAELKRWGEKSNLESAMQSLYQKVAEGEIAGAVLFSDGGFESGERSFFPPLFNRKLILVPVGDTSGRPDVSIRSVQYPPEAARDSVVHISAQIGAVDYHGDVTALLYANDSVIAARNVTIADSGGDEAVSFEMLAADEDIILTLELAQVEREVNVADNRKTFHIKSRAPTPIHVLLYSQMLSFDIGKLRSALGRFDNIHPETRLEVLKTPDESSMSYADQRFPERLDELLSYDLIIFGQVDFDTLTESRTQLIYDFVCTYGRGVVFLPGSDAFCFTRTHDPYIKILSPILSTSSPAQATVFSDGGKTPPPP